MKASKKETIKHSIAISIFVIIIFIVILLIVRYQVKGETNMPFTLSKITIISTAEGEQEEAVEGQENYKWNFNINQSNDVYFFIDKSEQYTGDSSIDQVQIENINIVKKPSKGTIKTYMPNSTEGRIFLYDDAFLVTDVLTYKGAKTSNEKTLEIGNQGGKVLIRFANDDIAKYRSNDDTEIVHNGTLLAKTGIKNEDIQFSVNFDFVITVGKINYRANITLDLPNGDITKDGTTNLEKTDLDDIVFKRN